MTEQELKLFIDARAGQLQEHGSVSQIHVGQHSGFGENCFRNGIDSALLWKVSRQRRLGKSLAALMPARIGALEAGC